jgi:hypothetical protein
VDFGAALRCGGGEPAVYGGKGMNGELKEFAKKQFPDSKSDLFAMFMQHAFSLQGEWF